MLPACSFFISSSTKQFSENLSSVIQNHDEPETVAAGIPAYLLMMETMLLQAPENASLLTSTASLYGVYAGMLVKDKQRKKVLANKAFNLSERMICLHDEKYCGISSLKNAEFEKLLNESNEDNIEALFHLGSAWASWVQTHSEDWNAVAQLAQVKAIMRRVIQVNEELQFASAHTYLGVMETIVPPAMGGNAEAAESHFKRASILAPNNLLNKVYYARHYARAIYDQELHDKLLHTVINSSAEIQNLTLINTIAKAEARTLLANGEDYF